MTKQTHISLTTLDLRSNGIVPSEFWGERDIEPTAKLLIKYEWKGEEEEEEKIKKWQLGHARISEELTVTSYRGI